MEEQNQYYDLSNAELYNELKNIEDAGAKLRELIAKSNINVEKSKKNMFYSFADQQILEKDIEKFTVVVAENTKKYELINNILNYRQSPTTIEGPQTHTEEQTEKHTE